MKNNNRIFEIISGTRNTDNTTWILKSAIKNPNCIIVAKNLKEAKRLEYEYHKLLSESLFIDKLIWYIFGKKHPTFMMLQNDFREYNMPIIFNNGVFC